MKRIRIEYDFENFRRNIIPMKREIMKIEKNINYKAAHYKIIKCCKILVKKKITMSCF